MYTRFSRMCGNVHDTSQVEWKDPEEAFLKAARVAVPDFDVLYDEAVKFFIMAHGSLSDQERDYHKDYVNYVVYHVAVSVVKGMVDVQGNALFPPVMVRTTIVDTWDPAFRDTPCYQELRKCAATLLSAVATRVTKTKGASMEAISAAFNIITYGHDMVL